MSARLGVAGKAPASQDLRRIRDTLACACHLVEAETTECHRYVDRGSLTLLFLVATQHRFANGLRRTERSRLSMRVFHPGHEGNGGKRALQCSREIRVRSRVQRK